MVNLHTGTSVVFLAEIQEISSVCCLHSSASISSVESKNVVADGASVLGVVEQRFSLPREESLFALSNMSSGAFLEGNDGVGFSLERETAISSMARRSTGLFKQASSISSRESVRRRTTVRVVLDFPHSLLPSLDDDRRCLDLDRKALSSADDVCKEGLLLDLERLPGDTLLAASSPASLFRTEDRRPEDLDLPREDEGDGDSVLVSVELDGRVLDLERRTVRESLWLLPVSRCPSVLAVLAVLDRIGVLLGIVVAVGPLSPWFQKEVWSEN